MNNDDRGQGRITTTVTTTQYVQQSRIEPVFVGVSTPELDVGYLRTLSGMVKCIAIALDFVCFICLLVGGPGYYPGAGWATFVCTVGMVVSLTLLFLYLFRVVDVVSQIPWIVSEMIFCFTWTIFFFIAGSVLAVAAARYTGMGFGVAAFFAFGAMCTYGFDCYLKFLSWRNNEVAHGGGPIDVYGDSSNPSVGVQKRVAVSEP